MLFKDYYLILGVQPTASQDEIKAAYRTLALTYHPDKATDNPFAAARFREAADAYRVLSHPSRRREHDEERWLRGATTRSKNAPNISATWLLNEANRLAQHMQTVDTYRMSHAALRDYILLLLSNEHLAVWHNEATPSQQTDLANLILEATKGQKTQWFSPIASRLLDTGNPDPQFPHHISSLVKQRRRKESIDKWMPLMVILVAIAICFTAFYLLHPN